MFLPNSTINPRDPNTWTLHAEKVGPYDVLVSYSPVRYSPAWPVFGDAHHFEARAILRTVAFGGDSVTYATEGEARDGINGFVARLRASVAA
jgi:hypothetical protein